MASARARDFGKLTADQLLMALQWQPALEAVEGDIRETLLQHPQRVAELAPKGFRWSGVYELPIEEHLARLVILMGQDKFVVAAGNSDDPAETVLDSLESPEFGEDANLNLTMVGDAHSFTYFLGLLWALMRSFECVAIYGSYINELVALAKSDHLERDRFLLRAIRIDPSVVAGPTASRRVSTALLMDDQPFLAELRLAMEGKTGDQVTYLRKFRKALKLLAESDALNGSPTALARKLVELGIYPKGFTAMKNASELIRKAQKGNAI